MKLKYYLRGCGIGIFSAVIIMMIALGTRDGVMTDAKVMERASELGMVMPEDTQADTEQLSETEALTQQAKPVISTQENTDQKETQKETQKEDKTKANTEQADTEQEETQQADTKDDRKKPGQNDSDQKPQNDESGQSTQKNDEKSTEADQSEDVIVVTIKRGEYCRAIAEKLYDKGLVKDAEEFRKYMQDNDYDNMIRVGTFHLKKGMTYKEIAMVLISKPE